KMGFPILNNLFLLGGIYLAFIYAIVMTIIGYIFMAVEKNKARNKKRRIRERTLFIVALLGGSVGVLLGMYTCRHKTKHVSFSFGIPAIIIGQIAIVAYLINGV